jgi:hypothetical protein
MTDTAIKFDGVSYSQQTLSGLATGSLVNLHNALARELGLPEVKRFSSKPVAVKRTWALLEKLPAPVQKAKTKRTPKAKAKKAAQPAPRAVFLSPVAAPKEAGGINADLFALVSSMGRTEREVLVDAALKALSPPRSRCFNRDFVLGYLAYGVNRGYYRKEVSEKGV